MEGRKRCDHAGAGSEWHLFDESPADPQVIRPHYARANDEGRTLIQTALQSAATLASSDTELRVTLSPLSSPRRSQAVAALCDTLNKARPVCQAPTSACDSPSRDIQTDQNRTSL